MSVCLSAHINLGRCGVCIWEQQPI